MFGPPRLMVIAAGVLQRKLLHELDTVQQQVSSKSNRQQQQQEVGEAVAGGKDAARSPRGSLEQQQHGAGRVKQQQAAPAGEENEEGVAGRQAEAVFAPAGGDGVSPEQVQEQQQEGYGDAQHWTIDQERALAGPSAAAAGEEAVGVSGAEPTRTDNAAVSVPYSSMSSSALSPFSAVAQNTWSLSSVSQASFRQAVASVLGTAPSGATSSTGEANLSSRAAAAGGGAAATGVRSSGMGNSIDADVVGAHWNPPAQQLGPLESGAFGLGGSGIAERGQERGTAESQSSVVAGLPLMGVRNGNAGSASTSPTLHSANFDALRQQQQQQVEMGSGRVVGGGGYERVAGEEHGDAAAAAAAVPASAPSGALGARFSGLSGWLAWSRAAATSSPEAASTGDGAAVNSPPPQASSASALPELGAAVSLSGCLPFPGGGSYNLEKTSSGKYSSRAASPRWQKSGPSSAYEGSTHGGGLLRHVWSANIEDLLAEASREKEKERWKEEKGGMLRGLRRSSTSILQYKRGRDGRARWR